LVTEFRKEMMAAVEEPVGRNANWSANDKLGGRAEPEVLDR